MKKYRDYMWLARVSGSILLLLSISLPLTNALTELFFLVPFLCISVDIVLWYYNQRVLAIIIDIIAVFAMIALFTQKGLTTVVSLWEVVVRMNSLADFLYVGFSIFTILCIPLAFVLCCFNKHMAAMIVSIMMVFAILVPISVSMFGWGKLLWEIAMGKNFLVGFLCAGSNIVAILCILMIFVLCCYNKRTAATVICIVAALASIPALAYIEVDDMPSTIFYNVYVFLGGVLLIVWSWIMDSDFPVVENLES